MKKKQISCFIMVFALSLSHMAAAEANAASRQWNTAPQEKIHFLKLNAKDYQIDCQRQILIHDSSTLRLKGDVENSSVTFKSSNPSVLTVQKKSESTCTYTGESSGTAILSVRIRSGRNRFFQNKVITLKEKISVSPRAVSIKFRRAKIKMTVGQKKKIKTTIRPSISKEKPSFTSTDPEIAYFQNQNLLRAKQAGTTYITASISNGMKVRCKVIVKNKANNTKDMQK